MRNTHSVWRTIQLLLLRHSPTLTQPIHQPTRVSRSVCVLMAHCPTHTYDQGVACRVLTLIFPVPRKASLHLGEAHTQGTFLSCVNKQANDRPAQEKGQSWSLVGKNVLELSGQPSPNADPDALPACTAMTVKSNKFLTAFQWMWQDDRVSLDLTRTTRTNGSYTKGDSGQDLTDLGKGQGVVTRCLQEMWGGPDGTYPDGGVVTAREDVARVIT